MLVLHVRSRLSTTPDLNPISPPDYILVQDTFLHCRFFLAPLWSQPSRGHLAGPEWAEGFAAFGLEELLVAVGFTLIFCFDTFERNVTRIASAFSMEAIVWFIRSWRVSWLSRLMIVSLRFWRPPQRTRTWMILKWLAQNFAPGLFSGCRCLKDG